MIKVGFALLLAILTISACTSKKETLTMDMESSSGDTNEDPLKNKGIGPIKSLTLSAIDEKLATDGEKIFATKCSACHKFDEKVVGPPLAGVTKRRSPEWIMNMILNTNEMVEKDPIVKSMIAEYMTKMTFQDVSQQDARAILEYFRKHDGTK